MLKTYAAATMLSAALLTGSALAQTAPVPRTETTAAAPSSTAPQSHQGLWRVSKLVGVNVYNESNESLGSINDLIVDNSGSIKNVIIGVGGFLGVGERYISVSFDKLKWSTDPVKTAASTPPAGGMDSQRTVGSTSTTPPASSTTMAKSNADNWYPDHAVLSASKDEVKSMPEFKY